MAIWPSPNEHRPMSEPLKLTAYEIDAAKSVRGGWKRVTLAQWGVPWPPPAGWRKALLNGEPIPMGIGVARAILAERNKGNLGPEADWSPEKIGRALRYLQVLASTPPDEWRSKREIHAALVEFR